MICWLTWTWGWGPFPSASFLRAALRAQAPGTHCLVLARAVLSGLTSHLVTSAWAWGPRFTAGAQLRLRPRRPPWEGPWAACAEPRGYSAGRHPPQVEGYFSGLRVPPDGDLLLTGSATAGVLRIARTASRARHSARHTQACVGATFHSPVLPPCSQQSTLGG